MTLRRSPMPRRRSPLKASRGTVIPPKVRAEVRERDNGRCLGAVLGWPGECAGVLEQDHIRVGGVGVKSRSTPDNLASLCSLTHHPWKTANGRVARPQLIRHIEEGATS